MTDLSSSQYSFSNYKFLLWTCTVPTGPTSPVRCRIVVLALEYLVVLHHKVLEVQQNRNVESLVVHHRMLKGSNS